MSKLAMSVINVDADEQQVKLQIVDVTGKYAYATLDYEMQSVQITDNDAGRLAGCFNSMHLISLITGATCLIDDLCDFYPDRMFFLA